MVAVHEFSAIKHKHTHLYIVHTSKFIYFAPMKMDMVTSVADMVTSVTRVKRMQREVTSYK